MVFINVMQKCDKVTSCHHENVVCPQKVIFWKRLTKNPSEIINQIQAISHSLYLIGYIQHPYRYCLFTHWSPLKWLQKFWGTPCSNMFKVRLLWLVSLPLEVSKLVCAWLAGSRGIFRKSTVMVLHIGFIIQDES